MVNRFEVVAREVALRLEPRIASDRGLRRGAFLERPGSVIHREEVHGARVAVAAERNEDEAGVDPELVRDRPLDERVLNDEARARRLATGAARHGLRRLAEVRVVGHEEERDVLRDLPAEEEPGPAQEQVLLEPGRIPRGGGLAAPVGPGLQEDAEAEVHVVVDLDDGLRIRDRRQQRDDQGKGDEGESIR